MEDYAAKMTAKADAELRRYVAEPGVYREAAVLAALDELRRRGTPAPEEAALRPQLEAALAALPAPVPDEPRPRAAVPDEAEATEAGPALYSPTSIVLFSLFNLLPGGVLLGLNLQRLKRYRALLGLVVFLGLYLVAGSYALLWAVQRFGMSPIYGLLFNVPAILAYLLWFWPRYVGQGPYRSRGLLLPLLVCVLAFWGLQRLNGYLMKQQPKEVQQEMQRLLGR